MISRTGYALWIALALACGTACAEEIRWAPDVATARKAALQYRVPVLLHFYGDNCLPCKVLEQNVLSRTEVIETLNKYFICVRVNASQDRQTAAEYGVHSWPTDVFIGPDGKTLDQGTCKQSAAEYLGVLHNIAVMNRDRNAMLAAQQMQSAQQTTSQVVAYPQPNLQTPAYPAQAALPAAGVAQADNPHGPNFYAQGAGTGLQQLPNSLTPNAGVISGPMLSENQPHAITTAVQAAGSQIAGASQNHVLNQQTGHLPPLEFNAQVPPAASNMAPNAMAAMVASAPSVPAAPLVAAVPNNAWNQSSVPANNSHSQMVDNPHFGNPATVASNNKIPASTVSFQPRAGSDLESKVDSNAAIASIPSAATPGLQPSVGVSSLSNKPALDGYCPVALKKQGAWVAGQSQFAVKHRGRIYHMSSQEAMQDFLQNPDRSSPVMSGYDAMVFLNEGKLVEGDIQYGLHEQVSGSILLFSSAESKQAYEQNFDRNTQALRIILSKAGIQL